MTTENNNSGVLPASKTEISNTSGKSSESNNQIYTYITNSNSEGNEKDGEEAEKGDKEKTKGPFEEYFDKLSEEINENNKKDSEKKIVKIGIGILQSDLKKISKNPEGGKVKATKITVFSDGTEKKEEIEVEISPQEAEQELNEENDKGSAKGIINEIVDSLKKSLVSAPKNVNQEFNSGVENAFYQSEKGSQGRD